MANEDTENPSQFIERPPEDDPGPRVGSNENTDSVHTDATPAEVERKADECDDPNTSWTAEVEESMESSSYNDSITSTNSRSALLKGETGTDSIPQEKNTILDIPFIPIVYEYKDYQDVANEDQYRSRSNTMMGLLESPAYIDSVNCPAPDRRRLARACRNAVLTLSQEIVPKKTIDVPHDPAKYDDVIPTGNDVEDPGDFNSINNHRNNLMFLGITVFLMATAIVSLKNLQSSLNHIDNVGLYSLAAGYGSFTVFSLFTPFIVQRFRPKRCLVIGLLPQVLYVVANLYPTFEILVTMAFLQGIGNAILWNAISTYVTYLARSYALKNDDRTVHVASKYFGIIFFFYQFSMVVGNLISSVVLMLGRSHDVPDTHNLTVTLFTRSSFNQSYSQPSADVLYSSREGRTGVCGSKYCHSDNLVLPNMTVNDETKYTLMGIFGLCVAFSVVVPMYLLSALKPYRTTRANCSLVWKQFTSVLKCTCDRRFLMLFLAFMYSSVQNSFVTGDVTKAFVTCPLGIHMVGYTMICFGVCGGLTSYLSGYINKHVGHVWLLTAGKPCIPFTKPDLKPCYTSIECIISLLILSFCFLFRFFLFRYSFLSFSFVSIFQVFNFSSFSD
ncbi:protein unc-93 homolog A-like isoform X2 [Pecten maximus]|uniref:protein unc-93 homolog A-like isoform X2 n=1 Tax=Pecten maximus TaxID=6579 RepID=UPI0014584948|nr:protein unc-93 homolog A-like isoform X2 [Pecten maximus]